MRLRRNVLLGNSNGKTNLRRYTSPLGLPKSRSRHPEKELLDILGTVSNEKHPRWPPKVWAAKPTTRVALPELPTALGWVSFLRTLQRHAVALELGVPRGQLSQGREALEQPAELDADVARSVRVPVEVSLAAFVLADAQASHLSVVPGTAHTP